MDAKEVIKDIIDQVNLTESRDYGGDFYDNYLTGKNKVLPESRKD
jgi:hypothetical protein